MKILVYALEPDLQTAKTKAFRLLDTSIQFNLNVEFVGISHAFTNFTNRLYVLQEYLAQINDDEIVLVMDGYDTLFNNTEEYIVAQFKSKKTRILISAEKMFTYQWGHFKDKFDSISSPYKYVNAGTYMGYCQDLRTMVDELIEINKTHSTEIDQGLLGIWAYNNLEKTHKMQLDVNCDVFWVTSADWSTIQTLSVMTNPNTHTTPAVIHNVGNTNQSIFLSYLHAYKIIMNRE